MFSKLAEWLSELPVLNWVFFGNSLATYAVAVIVTLVTFIAIFLTKKLVLSSIHSLSKEKRNPLTNLLLNFLETINPLFYFIIAVYIGSRYLSLSPFISTVVTNVTIVVFYIYLGLGLQHAADSFIQLMVRQDGDKIEKKRFDQGTTSFIKQVAIGIIWGIVFLSALVSFEYDISTLLAGLGVASVVIGFALQSVLADIFAYFTINLDKPFKQGDFIIVGTDMGTVKQVGIKNTRIKTLSGQDLIMTNRELTDSRVNNYATMERRRVEFSLPLDPTTKPEKLEQATKIVEKIIRAKEIVTFNRAHLKDIGEYSLNLEIVYHVEVPSFEKYMDVNQQILLETLRKFEKNNIEPAFRNIELAPAKK